MQFLLTLNYSKFVVNECASSEYVAVKISKQHYDHFRYAGTIDIAQATNAATKRLGLFTYFRTHAAYRDSEKDNWLYCDDNATLLVYARNGLAYIALDAEQKPYFTPLDLAIFGEVQIKKQSGIVNVVSLF